MTKLTMKFAVVALATMAAIAPSAGFAQASGDYGQGAAVAACVGGQATPGKCESAIGSFLDALRASDLTTAQQDDALAEFVASLLQSCADLPLSVRVALASEIRRVGTEFNDADRASQVASIADSLQTGTTVCTGSIRRTNIS